MPSASSLSILTQALTLALSLYLVQNVSGLRGNYGLSGLQNIPGLTEVPQSVVSVWFFLASAFALGLGGWETLFLVVRGMLAWELVAATWARLSALQLIPLLAVALLGKGSRVIARRRGADDFLVHTVGTGAHASPNMTMTMAAQDYVDMISGKLNGQMAFMSGKLKIAGDMGLAMKMQSLFKRP